MGQKIKYQYSYFIHPFVIKENKYQKYLLKLLKDKNVQLKIFRKEKDLRVYQYFLPKVQEFLFSSFGLSEAKMKKLEELNILLKIDEKEKQVLDTGSEEIENDEKEKEKER